MQEKSKKKILSLRQVGEINIGPMEAEWTLTTHLENYKLIMIARIRLAMTTTENVRLYSVLTISIAI